MTGVRWILWALAASALASACGEPDGDGDADGEPDGEPDGDADGDADEDVGEDAGEDADGADGGPCEGGLGPGSHFDRSLVVDGEERFYFLHVPAAYDCERGPAPALVDLHGTAGDRPELAYGLEPLVALAEAEGFVVVRPRSRSSLEAGMTIYRWDQNPGDLERNRRFVEALVEEVSGLVRLDPGRLRVSGFSSGTNMAAQLLGGSTFAGFGFVGGGYWNEPALPDWRGGLEAPRIYAVTGYRDYMRAYHRELADGLEAAGYPAERLFERQADAGHDLYGWHLVELWAWLDRGERPGAGELAPGWSREEVPARGEALLELAPAPGGALLASGSDGSLWRRSSEGLWSLVDRLEEGFAPAWTDLCVLEDGAGLAVGEGLLARTEDGGESWELAGRAPELGSPAFGYSYLTAVACGPSGRIVAGGYWTGLLSDDVGETWARSSFDAGGYDAQVAALAAGPDGAFHAAGYYHYAARSGDGAEFVRAGRLPGEAEWLNGVAVAPGGAVWLVGEAGTILRSGDGSLFDDLSVPGGEDLYAVAFRDALVGMAVGAHGAALLTEDGGESWLEVGTGLDGFLGDVAFLDDGRALAVGENGAALVYRL